MCLKQSMTNVQFGDTCKNMWKKHSLIVARISKQCSLIVVQISKECSLMIVNERWLILKLTQALISCGRRHVKRLVLGRFCQNDYSQHSYNNTHKLPHDCTLNFCHSAEAIISDVLSQQTTKLGMEMCRYEGASSVSQNLGHARWFFGWPHS